MRSACFDVIRLVGAAGALGWLSTVTPAARAQSVETLRDLSIEDLAAIQITSVSKAAQPVSDAPAAIYVISSDDILRSNQTTLPEILRLAPNLEVAQINAQSYAISARGFNVGLNASLSNKLLVLIDGRSVYTPLFGGVYWDLQEVPPENIARIEVISGPGASLWGANAVQGVVNIVTKGAAETQGGLLTLGAGSLQREADLQYGGSVTPDLTYRAHGELQEFKPFTQSSGASAQDGFTRPSGGFRLDWAPGGDEVSLSGDLLSATEQPNGYVQGADVAASWRHMLDGDGSVQALVYYDNERRTVQQGGAGFNVDTYDIQLQHSFDVAGWNSVVWGAEERYVEDSFRNTELQFQPPSGAFNIANVFGQDTVSLSSQLKLTLGIKLEAEPYTSGVQPMPTARLAWKPADAVLLWGAVSRAVRSPTPVDVNIRELAGPVVILSGSDRFRPEALTAYEAGLRVQPAPSASLSVSTFYDVYEDLRSIGPSLVPSVLPFVLGNLAAGHVYGAEIWGGYQIAPWWQLQSGFDVQHEDLHFKPGGGIAGLAFVADDPNWQAQLRSAIEFGGGVSWSADARYVGALPHPKVASYAELDTTVAWRITPSLDVLVSGFNLLHPQHREFLEVGESDEAPRSFFVKTRWRF